MQMLMNVVVVVQILAALAVIGLVLIQHGKGADMGASFGSGSSGSLFGATGSANFLSRTTAVCAAVFFCCTLALAYHANNRGASTGNESILDRAGAVPAGASAPVSEAPQVPGAAVSVPAAAAEAASGVAPAASAETVPGK